MHVSFFPPSGCSVNIHVWSCVDEKSDPGEDEGGSFGRVHFSDYCVRVLNNFCHHGSYPRPQTSEYADWRRTRCTSRKEHILQSEAALLIMP